MFGELTFHTTESGTRVAVERDPLGRFFVRSRTGGVLVFERELPTEIAARSVFEKHVEVLESI